MITILPNWHPIFVHFTIGLLGTGVVFYFASAFLAKDHKWKQQWQYVANWTLWSGCIFTLFTIFAGWYAYNTVTHDEASHAAMTLHRDWALATATLFLILGFAAVNIVKKNKTPRYLFLSVAAVAGAMLMITGFLGGEAVYRYGLGVMSLPEVGVESHHHDDETTAEPELDHLDQNMDIDFDMESDEHAKHSHDAEEKPAAPHEHRH